MTTAIAVANGPISFFTTTGTQVTVPVSALEFSAGKLQLGSTYTGPNPSGLQSWLSYLAIAGAIVPGPSAAPVAAIVFSAIDPGSTGNDVRVEIAYTSATNYTVNASKRDVYAGLTPSTLASVIGSAATLPSRPGLVRVADASAFSAPQVGASSLASGDVSVRASAPFDFGGGNKLTLEAKGVGDDGNLIHVALSDIDASAGTFTLTVTWSKTVSVDGTLSGTEQLDTISNGLGFVLSAAAPSTGFSLPEPGSFTLSGGSDSAAATNASATSLANS